MFYEEDVKEEEDSDEDFDIQTTTKLELPSTSKKGATVKRTKNKGVSLSQKPRRNSTRVTNKYRLKSKSMFNPSIKEENVIVIEEHSEDVEAGTRKKTKRSPLHKKPAKEVNRLFHHLQDLSQELQPDWQKLKKLLKVSVTSLKIKRITL
jgi:hypothetical protein